MERLRYMIDQQMRSFRLKLENSPHSIIRHQLYGSSDENSPILQQFFGRKFFGFLFLSKIFKFFHN